MPEHWYRIHIWFCVLCGFTATDRERVYGKKPKQGTHEYDEGACGCHFC